MVNSSSIVAALHFRVRVLDSQWNEAYEIHQIFQTEQTREKLREVFSQWKDASDSFWRLWELFGKPEYPIVYELPNPRSLA
jgi:hypothetical protein